MQAQNFSNHIRKHLLFHHFIVPLSLVLIAASGVSLVIVLNLPGFILFFSTILLHLIAFIARDYAKKNQDRIIRNEMRLRYFILTGESFTEQEKQFTTAQISALRFAHDQELLMLIKNPDTTKASPTEIKKNIKNWNPDYMRV